MLCCRLIDILEFESVTRESFGVAAIKDTETRSWGEFGDDVEVFNVPERYLFEKTPANNFVSKDRPSVGDLIRKKLPEEHKHRDMKEIVFDALKTFRSPYGPAGEINAKVIYDRCECIDPATGFHDFHLTCALPSVSIVKVLFTVEEATRKEKEDEESGELYAYAYEEVDDFLFSKEGKKALKTEVRLRRKFCKRDIRKKKRTVKELGMEHKQAKRALRAVQDRKKQFDKGAAIAFHRFKNAGEAIVAVDEAIQVVQDAQETQLRVKEELKACKLKLKEKNPVWTGEAGVDLSEAVGEKLTKKVCLHLSSHVLMAIFTTSIRFTCHRLLLRTGKLRERRASVGPGMALQVLTT
jgi:hypothetical protein